MIDTDETRVIGSAGTRVVHLSAPLLNAVAALVLLAVAAWLWIGAADIETSGGDVLGPDGFPRLVAALLGVCCCVLLIQSVRGAVARSGATVVVSRPLQVLGAVMLVCLYPVLIGAVGYYLATALWMPPFLWLAGMRNPLGIGASVAGFLLFTKVLFEMVLAIPLP